MHSFSNSLFPRAKAGFSLIEVVLAIGIFLVTILALVGLLGPTLQSVDNVEKTDEVASVVNTINAFLQSSPDIGNPSATPPTSKFAEIYNAVGTGQHATIFVFRRYIGDEGSDVELTVGFWGETNAQLTAGDFNNAAGPIYRVVLTPSSVLPIAYRSAERIESTGTFTLDSALADYAEGYFAMEVRIFVEDPPAPGVAFSAVKALTDLVEIKPLFTYNTAIVR